MEFKPVEMSLSYEGGMRFTASNPSGVSFQIEAPVGMGGEGKTPNPLEYIIGSLGGCIGVKILLSLSDNRIVPDSLTIGIHATRRKTMPAIFDNVQMMITLCADVDDELVSDIVNRTLTYLCPIAAMFAEVGELTAKHRIIRK